ncbi:MAG: tRNA (N6-isopentenyl adenosine(37)-C2)-methylthiotransferase MiaB [Dehalococcoidia bacterium]|nr:tRNA (N6-isopentenyl adenosine(37)-C2)-methylthiotransferase MiaB [Dehalococcoidia bacterium]
MESFHIWTIGCQMNKADSQRLGSALEQLGLREVGTANEADLVVLNSCVVRQQAEDKVVGNLTWMKPWRSEDPDRVVALMGCMVGSNTDELARRFPFVDLFMPPQQYGPLLELVGERVGLDWEGCVGSLAPAQPDVTCYVPIIHGCDLMCTFCIIPYRRGRQVSRPVDELVHEVELLVDRGVKEVTVLGQTVDAYGLDLPGKPDLGYLLAQLNDVAGLERIRFLPSHPSFFTDEIIHAVADLPKVCEHINLPVQAGDDEVLKAMRRPYTRQEFKDLVGRIRDIVPHSSLATDIIVGFPGETGEQFQRTVELIAELRPDKVHCAAYSHRPGTIAGRMMEAGVSKEEKSRGRVQLEDLQQGILTEINSALLGQEVDILVEGRRDGKWHGRTRTDKLVFFQSEDEYLGQLVNLNITKTGPWSLQGELVQSQVHSHS